MKLSQSKLFFSLQKILPLFVKYPFLYLYTMKQQRKLLKREYPVCLTYFITYRCNLKCPFCFIDKSAHGTGNELDEESISKLASSLKGIVKQLVITGGEPFVKENIVNACQLFVSNADLSNLHMVTNGYYTERIEDFCIQLLRNKDLRLSFQLSLDGPKNHHDSIRGKGSFNHMMETARLLGDLKKRNNNFGNITVVTMLTNDNTPHLKETIEIVKSYGFFHEFNLVRGAEYSTNIKDESLLGDFNPKSEKYYIDNKQIEKVIENLFKMVNNTESTIAEKLVRQKFNYIIKFYKSGKTGLNCTAGRNEVVILPSGDVSVCEMYKPFGNLRDYSYDFRKFWKHSKISSILKSVDFCSCAHDCSVINSIPFNLEALKRIFK